MNRIKEGLEWFETRRYWVFWLFATIAALGIVFLYAGLYYNPNIHRIFIEQPTPTSIYGQTEFELPNFLDNGQSQIVKVFCNVTSYKLVEGSYALLQIDVEAPTSIYNYTYMNVEPHNALDYDSYYDEFSNESPKLSWIPLLFDHSKDLSDVWKGKRLVIFQTDGNLQCNIHVLRNPTDILWDVVNWTEYDNAFSQEITFETIDIKSGAEVQQEMNEDMNLSLALLVAFFASVEISITLYDHSEDKEKKAEYDRRKKARKQSEIEYTEFDY